MELGLFAMPAHPPERDLKAGFEWDLEVIRLIDQLGYQEAWSASTIPSPGSPIPRPTCCSVWTQTPISVTSSGWRRPTPN